MGRIWDGVLIMGRVCRCGIKLLEVYRMYYGMDKGGEMVVQGNYIVS